MKVKDIDSIIEQVRHLIHEVDVAQNPKIHEADDDHLWWFRLPDLKQNVQIESADGNCPFWLETSSMPDAMHSLQLSSVAEVVGAITSYLLEAGRS